MEVYQLVDCLVWDQVAAGSNPAFHTTLRVPLATVTSTVN